ncbi:unnamed protein product [Rotaria magnacalcarata]|uniref:EGF-like domain-containing protein n=2 Tax=Rotaria magnacalcarata TaxID=392030 RepID=A0A8S2M918_9BILA|nr:unnamed protein product [Rotaria magnacalcarata]CAF3940231.1 unnamed protein product [Rotaria magnacalcarata]CAF4070149.1 unnamed protein product [Rotaria magnacalcarata]
MTIQSCLTVQKSHFRTFSSGFLLGKEILAYNYSQTIKCTPNKAYPTTFKAPVHHLKKLFTIPIYNEDEETLEWFTEPILELNESSICPDGFERKGKFCHECNNCQSDICEKGYRKNFETGLCEDIDECIEHTTICQYMCENQIGSYRCYCPIGFKMNNSGQCQDINECHQFQIECGQDRTCFNTRGAYECIDIPCPVGYIRQNENDCLLKCYQRLSSCRPRQPIYIRHRFIALSRLTSSNRTFFSLPIVNRNRTSIKLFDKSNPNMPLPFIIDGIDLKTNQTLFDSHEYELEIYVYNNEFNGKHSSQHHRRRLHTIYVIRINISPFHF